MAYQDRNTYTARMRQERERDAFMAEQQRKFEAQDVDGECSGLVGEPFCTGAYCTCRV